MDKLTKPLNTYLVKMAYEEVTHEQEHQMKHLLSLLTSDDEQTVVSYYGLFNEPRLALADIAASRHMQAEDALVVIEQSLRRMAVSPEWQMIISK